MMSLTFNDSAVNAVFAALISDAQQLGRFKKVIGHEPKAPPENFPTYALWWERIVPAGRASGLAAVSGVVTFKGRVYQEQMLAEPQDSIDPGLLATTALLLAQYTGAFTLGGLVRDVDVFGEFGQPLEATAGFIPHASQWLRVADITIPVVINDMWTEAP